MVNPLLRREVEPANLRPSYDFIVVGGGSAGRSTYTKRIIPCYTATAPLILGVKILNNVTFFKQYVKKIIAQYL